MSAKVYVITDKSAIEFIENNDIEGFRKYLKDEDTLYFEEALQFETEKEALAFCAGLGYGVDDHNPVDRLPLRSFEEYDQPFIELIEKY